MTSQITVPSDLQPRSSSKLQAARSLAFASLWSTALLLGFACSKSDDSTADTSVNAAESGSDSKEKQEDFSQSMRFRERPRVRVAPVEQREMLRTFETSTTVESESEVILFSRAAGTLVELLAEEGDRVAKDQVLARLDDREALNLMHDAELAVTEAKDTLPRLKLSTSEATARVNGARRSYEQARRDHDRNQAISTGDDNGPALISKKDFDASQLAMDQALSEFEQAKIAKSRAELEESDAKNAVTRAKLNFEKAQLTWSFTRIEAPFDGVVSKRTVKVGDAVSSASEAFTLTNPDRLRAIFLRPQRELSLFRGGLTGGASDNTENGLTVAIEARAEAVPGHLFRGRIERVSPTIDPASGNFRVTVLMDPLAEPLDSADASSSKSMTAPRLLPGMLIRLSVVTDRHQNALVVPKRGIRRQGDASALYVVRENKAERIEVTEGYSDDDFVEVMPSDGKELRPDELVIVVGNRDLEEGAEVEVVQDEEAGSTTAKQDELEGQDVRAADTDTATASN